MNFHITWGILIALYLFTAGVSAGAAVLASVLDIFPIGHHEAGRAGAYLAPFPVMLGLLCLMLDLTQSSRFYLVLLHYNLTSVMSWGVIFLVIFPPLALLYGFIWYYGWQHPVRKVLAWFNLLLGLAVGGYTGLLLLAAGIANPVWGNPVIAVLFVISAMSTGVCGSILVGKVILRLKPDDLGGLVKADVVIIAGELVTILILLLSWAMEPAGGAAFRSLVTGGYYLWFWLGVILLGLMLPLILEFPHLGFAGQAKGYLLVLAPLLVLAGGFILRFVIVYGGQLSISIN